MENKIKTLNEINVTSNNKTTKSNAYSYIENGCPINLLDKEKRELVEKIGRYYISNLSDEEIFELLEYLISKVKLIYNGLNVRYHAQLYANKKKETN